MYWTNKHVLVCTASHCNQKGAMDVVGRLRLDILRKGLDTEILVNNCGTIDLCDCGPNMVVYPDNVIYSGVTVKDIPEIVEHLRGGPVVERLVLAAETPAESVRHDFYEEAVAAAEGLPPGEAEELAVRHGLDQAWIDEQIRRGFMARKPHPDSGEDRLQVTKKARARYGVPPAIA
jgi:(2Fe-2S) ferredoxin